MMDHWAKSGHWKEVTLKDAHKLANEGEIVMVGWHSQSAESGHVAVVVPGKLQDSGSWGHPVPRTFDTGATARQSSDKLTNGFGKDKKLGTKFYVYKGPINK